MNRWSHVIIIVILTAQLAVAEPIVRADNPNPGYLPTIEVSHRMEWNQEFYYVTADFPNVPGLVCDLWCFESPDVEFATAERLENGAVKMVHTWKNHDRQVVTVVRPEPGALDFVSTLSPAPHSKEVSSPTEYPNLNVCWQLRSATAFCSKPDPYPEFVKRCFIFTERGHTFLDQTVRRRIPVRKPDDPYNNPPWVQMYLPVSSPDIRAGTGSWADYSTDHYLYPVIGAVSRDGKYLTALASASAPVMCQAWHDCMHNNPGWLASPGTTEKEWHIRVYGMENDPDKLLDRVKKDFPGLGDR